MHTSERLNVLHLLTLTERLALWVQEISYPLGTARPLYRTGVSLLSRERFLYI